jgi:hypothetical protein
MEVEIRFNVKFIGEISNVLNQVKKQISEGEFYPEKNENGYLINKYNDIRIYNEHGFTIGQFRIREGLE